ncbi:MAG: hypothetical protein HeimC3_30600 [Candidatus Heimdallarchaeota archaeon LC_3]|nr:MAG: hypothetical protein HeimC3_30600 [Candidatus Heimdallarchaeota archaeon LC_3]
MAKASTQKEGLQPFKNTELFSSEIVRKVGNSIGILLDNIVSTMGFAEGTHIQIEVELNKIVIIPEKPKTHKSVIKYLKKSGPKLIPEFFDKTDLKKESARFEDVYNNRTEHFTFLVSYDHIEKNYLLIYAKKNGGGRTVRYITEDVYQAIKEGKNPENYFIIK